MPTPEDQAREHIDQALEQAGWKVQDYKNANLRAGRGEVLRNFPLQSGHGFAPEVENGTHLKSHETKCCEGFCRRLQGANNERRVTIPDT